MNSIPEHLQKYIVEQRYERYTPIDQAVWRHCLKRLKTFLSVHAHESYLDGLEKTGIDLEQIPRIENISAKLEKFGWRALPVSGFIPPAAFMELQSLGILPIASDMRSMDHLLYTPAPDIVHEAAGHAPIIVDAEYADYLREYSQVAKKAILSKEDLDVYEAIRDLSDIKEDPRATPEQIQAAEKKLEQTVKSVTFVSEATQLSRMNWWTAEYGLVGSLEKPRIFGAGLLSSVGESKWCLSQEVKKIPLTLDCINQTYDITEPQPQLFVTPNFKHLKTVLHQLSETMAYKLGGLKGLERAQKAKTVCTAELNSGLQISGVVEFFLTDQDQEPIFLKFSGPTQICFSDQEISGQEKNYHHHGYSTPIGSFKVISTTGGLVAGEQCRLEYDSGFVVDGRLIEIVKSVGSVHPTDRANSSDSDHRTASGKTFEILRFEQATVTYKGKTYFEPDWGVFDLAKGERVVSVYGGPADRKSYGHTDDFVAKVIPIPNYNDQQIEIFDLYQKVRDLRKQNNLDFAAIRSIYEAAKEKALNHWLLFFEILEIVVDRFLDTEFEKELVRHLELIASKNSNKSEPIRDALQMLFAHRTA